jgi:hypothetical protein
MDFFSSSLTLCHFMNYVSCQLNKVIKYSLDFPQSLLLYHIEVGKCHNWNLCLWAQLTTEWEVNNFVPIQEIRFILWKSKIHHKGRLPVPIISQMNPLSYPMSLRPFTYFPPHIRLQVFQRLLLGCSEQTPYEEAISLPTVIMQSYIFLEPNC